MKIELHMLSEEEQIDAKNTLDFLRDIIEEDELHGWARFHQENRRYVNMARGGSGGDGYDSVRNKLYPGFSDTYFQYVCQEMAWTF